MFDFFDVIISFLFLLIYISVCLLQLTRRDGVLNTEINETPPAVLRVFGRVVVCHHREPANTLGALHEVQRVPQLQ